MVEDEEDGGREGEGGDVVEVVGVCSLVVVGVAVVVAVVVVGVESVAVTDGGGTAKKREGEGG